jgi:tetratricopeptide (TPR) repeat protein
LDLFLIQRLDPAALGDTLASTGRRSDASKILEKLIQRSQHIYVAPLSMALIHAGLGQKDEALELLEKGYAEHDPWLVQFLRNYHQFDELRPDSRFAELMQRIGVSSAQNNQLRDRFPDQSLLAEPLKGALKN